VALYTRGVLASQTLTAPLLISRITERADPKGRAVILLKTAFQ